MRVAYLWQGLRNAISQEPLSSIFPIFYVGTSITCLDVKWKDFGRSLANKKMALINFFIENFVKEGVRSFPLFSENTFSVPCLFFSHRSSAGVTARSDALSQAGELHHSLGHWHPPPCTYQHANAVGTVPGPRHVKNGHQQTLHAATGRSAWVKNQIYTFGTKSFWMFFTVWY